MPLDTKKSDSELFSEFQKTRVAALMEILFNRYRVLVYGLCLRYLKEREASRDATMAVFEKLLALEPTVQVKNFKSWLYVITKNHCLMQLRADKKIKKESIYFMDFPLELHPIDEEDNQHSKLLHTCIEQLKTEQRKCIELFYLGGSTYQSAAKQLSMEVKKVKSHIQNGKRNLKICLEEEK